MPKLTKKQKLALLLYLRQKKRRKTMAVRRVRSLYMRPVNINRDQIAYDKLHLVVDVVSSNLQ